MLKINNQSRGSGKTTKVIELVEKDKEALCLVPNFNIIRLLYPKSLHNRIISSSSVEFDIKDIIFEMRSRGLNKLYIDELILSKFDIAELFYELGKSHIQVIVYGTEGV